MRLRLLSFCAVALMFIPSAWAEDWSKTFQLSGKPSLRVETSDANIHVETWDQNAIETRVTAEGWKIGEGGLKIIDSQTGDTVKLEVRFPREFHVGFHHTYHKVQIAIHMPREGHVSLHTGDGDIQLGSFKGDMELDSGDGRLEVSAVEGKLRVHTGDGRIEADGKFNGLDISTGDGRVEARASAGSSVGTGWNLQSGDGSITLEVPVDFAADLELRTGDGRITVDVPVTVEGHLSENNISGKINGGGSPVRIHTGDGEIHLKKLDSV